MRYVFRAGSSEPDLQARIALLGIVRVRFFAFESKFGRQPLKDEPLFFDESQSQPIRADIGETRTQLARAARSAGVELDLVLNFLGLSSTKANIAQRSATLPSARQGGRYRAQPIGSDRRKLENRAGWNRFLVNERLHRRHRITPGELKALSGVSLLGHAGSEGDFLMILKLLRERKEG